MARYPRRARGGYSRRRTRYSSTSRRRRGGYARSYSRSRRGVSRRRSPATQTVRVVIQQGPSASVNGAAISMTGLRKARF